MHTYRDLPMKDWKRIFKVVSESMSAYMLQFHKLPVKYLVSVFSIKLEQLQYGLKTYSRT